MLWQPCIWSIFLNLFIKSIIQYSPLIKHNLASIGMVHVVSFCLIVLIFMSQSPNFQSCRDRSSWVEPVLRRGRSVLLKDTTHSSVALCYKQVMLFRFNFTKKVTGKWPFSWSFSYNPFVKFHSEKIWCPKHDHVIVCLFVLLLYVPSQQLWSWRDGQFTLPHFFLGKLEQAVNQYFMHILLLVTDNNPSWMIQRKGGEWS